MTIFSVFQLLGGIGLFLFGMHVMGDAIARQAGGQMKTILEGLTSSRLKGLLLGTAVTAIIQSSAATSVMVLGFVNTGIMTLYNAIPVIMGANIGTTATAWILCLNTINGESFVLKLLNPDTFVPILACIGAFMLMFSKKDSKKNLALIMLGFSVLMYGMDFMSSSLDPIKESPVIVQVMTLFSNPVIGVIIGFTLAVTIQSSSASVGILQALSATGVVDFATALPIVIGINIGATIIVIFSGVGGPTAGKRAAFIAFLYNIIGAVVVLGAFELATHLFGLPLAGYTMGYVSIAMTHTGYKTLIALIQLPFIDQLVAVSRKIYPDSPEEEKFSMLDTRFFSTPTIAVQTSSDLTMEMASITRENLNLAMDTLYHYSEETVSRVQVSENQVDLYEDRLGTYMAKLAGHEMNDSDRNELTLLLHCIGDFERISDHSVNITETATEMHQKNIRFSNGAQEELAVMIRAVLEIVDVTTDAFLQNSPALAKQVEPLEEIIDNLTVQLKARHVTRLQRGECTTLLGFVFSDLITSLERIADHCSNIAISIIQSGTNSYEAHIYLDRLRASDDRGFREMYSRYQQKYQLPDA
ncbi:MAG: Na/Pi cotransporter family protein [Oscillospiraceae bacterium]|nr:Na/Pi cotransporter family protein [Oscillospiraceae bacterium]